MEHRPDFQRSLRDTECPLHVPELLVVVVDLVGRKVGVGPIALETIPDLVLLYLVLVDADRDSGTDAEELVVPAFVDVGFGQGSLCVSLSEALYTLVPVVLVLPRTVLRVTYDEAVAVAIRDIVEDARLVRRGQNEVLHSA